jgi:hypothetical protein
LRPGVEGRRGNGQLLTESRHHAQNARRWAEEVSKFNPPWGKKRNDAVRLEDRVKRLTDALDKPGGKASAPTVPVSRSRARAPRQATFTPAALVFDGGVRLEIVVKNISETGAQVQSSPGGTLVGREADLVAPTLGRRRRARIVWQKAGFLGLRFLD